MPTSARRTNRPRTNRPGTNRPSPSLRVAAVAAAACIAGILALSDPVTNALAAARVTSPGSVQTIMSPAYAYDMFTAEGGVLNFGGAGWYGNEKWRHLSAPIVG